MALWRNRIKYFQHLLQNKTELSARNFKIKLIQQFGRIQNKVV